MANPTLEENQVREFTDVVAKYKFTAVGGGAEMAESGEKMALKPGIRLHFLRYALFYKKSKKDVTASINEATRVNENGKKYYGSEVLASHDNMPELENFYIARTSLNSGYIYLFNANDPEGNDCHEYEVHEDGSLSTILWANNKDENGFYKDIRKSEGDSFRFKTISVEKTYWCAYSPVQWTEKYLQETRKDAAKTEARMQKVECRGINKDGDSHENAISYKELYAVHYKGHTSHEVLNGIIKDIDADERRQDTEDEENEIFEDMFVTLDDPIGCAGDIAHLLNEQIIYHQANVEAIRFGKDPEVVAEIIKNEGESTVSSEQLEISDMFSLALTTYQLVYNDPESIDKFDGGVEGNPTTWHFHMMGMAVTKDGKGILKQKLLDVLGVEERKKQRAAIRAIQGDFATLIQDPYYDAALIDFAEGSDLCNFIGKIIIHNDLRLLAINPHDIDRSLDLRAHQENDYPWHTYLEHCFTCTEITSNLDKTLDRQIDIDEKIEKDAAKMGFTLTIKLAQFANSLLESVAQLTTQRETIEVIEDMMRVYVTRLNRVTAFGLEMYELRGSQVYDNLPNRNTDFNFDANRDLGRYTGEADLVRFRVDSPHIALIHSSHGEHIFNMPVNTNTTVLIDEPTSAASRARAFVNSDGFRGTVGLLQIFNLGVASTTLIKNNNWKNRVNLIGVTAELSEAVLQFRNSRLLTSGGRELSRFGRMGLRGTGVAAAGITVIMCAWDAYDSFGARDDDAAWAYVGAGAAFTGVTVATVFASASWAGPLGWICAGIGLGFVFLAYILTDSPLEKYFKHFIFSDLKQLPNTTDLPTWEFNNFFYKERQKLIGDDNDMNYLIDSSRAGAQLHDLLVCSAISITPQNLVREEMITHKIDLKISQTINTGYANAFILNVNFNQFLQHKNQFICEAYYYENGISNALTSPIYGLNSKKMIAGTDDNPPQIEQHITIPQAISKNANPRSCILVICKLALHTQSYYPVSYNGKDRWLGAVINVQQTTATSILTFDFTGKKQTTIAEKSDLLSGNAWR